MDVTPNKTSRQTRTWNSHSTSGCSPRAPSTHMHRCMQGSALHLVTWLPVRARHIQPHGHTRKEPCTRHMLCFLPGEGQGRGRCQCAPSLKPALALVPSRASVVPSPGRAQDWAQGWDRTGWGQQLQIRGLQLGTCRCCVEGLATPAVGGRNRGTLDVAGRECSLPIWEGECVSSPL